MEDFDENLEEDLEFARRTEEAYKEIEAGKLMDQLNNYYLQLAQKQAGNSELSELAYINAFNRVIIQY